VTDVGEVREFVAQGGGAVVGRTQVEREDRPRGQKRRFRKDDQGKEGRRVAPIFHQFRVSAKRVLVR